MEKKIYTDDFEQFLKETADDFRMYPSKRVWNSLYNNLHPGRKWPSLAVCLLLVSSIIFIGISHKNEITGTAYLVKKDAPATLIAYQKQHDTKLEAASPAGPSGRAAIAADNNMQGQIIHPAVVSANGQIRQQALFTGKDPITAAVAVKDKSAAAGGQDRTLTATANSHNSSAYTITQSSGTQLTSALAPNDRSTNAEDKINELVAETNMIASAKINNRENTIEINSIQKPRPVATASLMPAVKSSNNQDKEWMEDYAFHNQPAPSLKSKVVYELYITPSIGYRTLAKNVNYTVPARASLITLPAAAPLPNTLQQDPALNVEAGYNLLYAYSKAIRLKGGLQLNYTNYRIHAHEQGHSSLTTLMLNNRYTGIELSQRSSTLANFPGDAADEKLNNNTFQVSLPFGADIKLAGKKDLQWFAGATIQPSYILFGNAYLISADQKNYVYDAGFLRKWNMNAGIETFLSYKTKKGIIFNAGPQLRYQFFSTYRKSYSYDEKLYNLGIKLGMVRNF